MQKKKKKKGTTTEQQQQLTEASVHSPKPCFVMNAQFL